MRLVLKYNRTYGNRGQLEKSNLVILTTIIRRRTITFALDSPPADTVLWAPMSRPDTTTINTLTEALSRYVSVVVVVVLVRAGCAAML